MTSLAELWRNWRQDRLIRRVIRNTGYLFSSNTAGMVLSVVQSIFAARLLGVAGFGVLGTVTVYASTVNRLFSFRMGELVVKYFGGYLEEKQPERAAAIVKVAGLVEGGSSVLAFALLAALAPVAAVIFAKDPSTAYLFFIYGFSVLGSIVAETSGGILQVDNRFRAQAVLNLIQSVLTAAIIAAVFFIPFQNQQTNMLVVLLAYLIGKMVLGLGPLALALGSLNRLLGRGWWRARLDVLPPWRELGVFGISTNLSATVNLLVRDSELLWVSFFLSPLQAGYYKVALAIINLVLMPVTPLISTTYPEINRTIAGRAWPQLRQLLRRITALSGGWTVAAGLGLLLFGNFLILFYGAEYLPAYPAMLTLLAGFGVANIFFWNRPLLLSFGQPMTPFWATLIAGAAKVGLSFWLVPRYGYVMEAALLSGYFAVSVGWIVWRGMRLMAQAERTVAVEAA